MENRLHWVRDVVTGEDRHQLRVGNAPLVSATLRNLAISFIRLLHGANVPIAATTRAMAPRPRRAIDLITAHPNEPTPPRPWTPTRQPPPRQRHTPTTPQTGRAT